PVYVGEGLRPLLPRLLQEAFAGGGGALPERALPERAQPEQSLPERALVVTQAPVVDAGHVAPVEEALRRLGIEVVRQLVPDGERAKSVEVLGELWRSAARLPLTRRDVVVAVGGGVVGDLGGFLAATYARGIDVVQVPTTVLAQVDAAIGGKTGINLPEGKNLVGAFHQPRAVVCDVATLTTLPERIHREGFGEIAKYGLIRDTGMLALLEASPEVAKAGSSPLLPSLLRELVERSVVVKAEVVAADEREAGERAHLNLGHTFGHAVEALTGYDSVLHGEAVAIGTVVALRIGVALGTTDAEVADRGEAVLTALGLPTRPPVLDREAVWAAMGRDKKSSSGAVRFVLLEDVGRPVLVTPPREVVDAVLDELEAEAGR
ncbi:MAG: 3-dehydroquinate synthase, partial [Actinomycetota bacterium]